MKYIASLLALLMLSTFGTTAFASQPCCETAASCCEDAGDCCDG